jgi:molecular chaperone IbpA
MTSIRTSNISNLFDNLNRVALGYDNIFHDIENRWTNASTSNYPPYNVVKNQDGVISLEIAVAGFKKSEIEIEQHQGKLTISGKKTPPPEGTELKYHHKGISERSFKLSWTLAEYMEVTGAELEDGILTIVLEQEIPEAARPKLIEINSTPSLGNS